MPRNIEYITTPPAACQALFLKFRKIILPQGKRAKEREEGDQQAAVRGLLISFPVFGAFFLWDYLPLIWRS